VDNLANGKYLATGAAVVGGERFRIGILGVVDAKKSRRPVRSSGHARGDVRRRRRGQWTWSST
jgi:hypothetical protein